MDIDPFKFREMSLSEIPDLEICKGVAGWKLILMLHLNK